MAMNAASERTERRMTVAEFLAWNDGTETRYELVNGMLVAMNQPAIRHALVCDNIGRALERQVRPPCRVFRAIAGVAHGEDDRTWREPDLVVTCKRPAEGFIAEPRFVVEVLSPSTEREDRTVKLDFYESFPTLEAVLLV
ncbi:Uma2 family endonuclease [Benzoatithermus flavus]|uniref:Uma2 family endonuclease n=1 Tax=Benzoatithermus flavus TaxID=3108223 RepID=A0ABU8XN69_9PROT